MDLQIFSKNVEITDLIRDYIQKKTTKLNRYLSNIDESKVEITSERTKSPDDRFKVQITVRSKGNILRAEERAPSINLAIDETVDSLVRRISRFKKKYDKKGSSPLFAANRTPKALVVENEVEDLSRVVKVKNFLVESMSVNEAINRMELLNHDFFLFLNAELKAMNLVYRRKNGNYGLIRPEISAD